MPGASLMGSQQFHLDMAKAYAKSTTAVNTALSAAHAAEAARKAPAPPPVPAPPVTPPPPAVAGVRLFSDASPFNTPTPGTVKWVNQPLLSTYWWVDNVAANIVYAVDSDPTWTFNAPAYIAAGWNRNRPKATYTVKAPAGLKAGADSDKILVLVQPDGSYYEIWQTIVDSSKRTITSNDGSGNVGWAMGNCITGPGAGTVSNNDGVRASNFSWAAGLITGADVAAGVIDHALVVALNGPMLKSGNSYVAPATAGESTGDGPIPCGTKIGIPSGTARPNGLSPLGIAVFNALAKYGAYVGDYTGGAPQFYAEAGKVTSAQITPLYDNWDGHPSDLDLIAPLLRQAA